MSKSVKPFLLRQSDDGKWEAEIEAGKWVSCETKKDADILPNASKVRLWTWQNPNFVITDRNMRVESKTHSKCLNVNSRLPGAANQHLKGYEKLWSVLKTDQFLWYYTDREEATNSSSLVKYQGEVLWEIEIPENRVFKRICEMAWHRILYGSSAGRLSLSPIFDNFFKRLLPSLSWNYIKTPVGPIFNKPWQDMKPQQLWSCLFPDCSIQQCYQVLVRHPVDASCVLRDPRNDNNWWQKHQPN